MVRFREKPDLATARRYLRSGNYLWNAGIFFWPAALYLERLRECLPGTHGRIAALPPFGSRQFARRLEQEFPLCDNISVDYAVLEKTPGIAGFAAGDIGWSDLGSFNAVYELLAKDADSNASSGPLLALDARGNYADAPGKLRNTCLVFDPQGRQAARHSTQAERHSKGVIPKTEPPRSAQALVTHPAAQIQRGRLPPQKTRTL